MAKIKGNRPVGRNNNRPGYDIATLLRIITVVSSPNPTLEEGKGSGDFGKKLGPVDYHNGCYTMANNMLEVHCTAHISFFRSFLILFNTIVT